MYGLQKERPEPVSVRDARWQPSPENCTGTYDQQDAEGKAEAKEEAKEKDKK